MRIEERKNAIHCLKVMAEIANCEDCELYGTTGTDHCERDCVRNAIEALEQEPCEDAVSRQAVIDILDDMTKDYAKSNDFEKVNGVAWVKVQKLPSVNPQKIGYCKDCKWWKDSDGAYRRGIGAESQCPMNRIEVIEGNGYCYMFKPQESEVKENE